MNVQTFEDSKYRFKAKVYYENGELKVVSKDDRKPGFWDWISTNVLPVVNKMTQLEAKII